MRRFIVVTLFATMLTSIFFVTLRNEPVAFEELSAAQQRQNETTQYIAPQTENRPPGNTGSDAQIADEGIIAINWRELPHRNFVFPNGTPLENYEYYKALAELGNGLAAHQLANMMLGCRHSFRTKEELDAGIVQMRETFTFTDPESKANVRIGEPAEVNQYIENATQQFENCRGFTHEQRTEHKVWLELAANNGHTTAMLDYGHQLEDPQASIELYRSTWREGDANALLSLAVGLEQIYDRGIDPSAKVPAYAAMHAFVTLLRAAHGADPERIVGRRTLRNQAKLEEMAKEMLPDELERAGELSRQLITSNENCCYSM